MGDVMKKCPHCGISVGGEESRCWYCDADLRNSDKKQVTEHKPPRKRIKQKNNSEEGPLFDRTKNLVISAHILATSSLKNFQETYPKLSRVDPLDWDFFFTVAAISYAVMSLANMVSSQSSYRKLTAILSQEMQNWNPRAEYAMGDLMKTLHKAWQDAQHLDNKDATDLLAALLGAWCMVNFQLPVQRERPDPLALALGMSIIVSFNDWWKVE
jgi:hypothetical protein